MTPICARSIDQRRVRGCGGTAVRRVMIRTRKVGHEVGLRKGESRLSLALVDRGPRVGYLETQTRFAGPSAISARRSTSAWVLVGQMSIGPTNRERQGGQVPIFRRGISY